MKDLIISLAVDGREKYSERVKGLERSIVAAEWQGDVRIYKEFPEWCTLHSVIPYRFKIELIGEAIKEKYDRIYWMDSTMRLIPGKNISHLLHASKNGVVAFDNLGHPLKNYINDTAISNLRTSVDELDGVKQTWGGCVFWDLNKSIACDVYNKLSMQSVLGSFNDDTTNRPGFIAHRHDQAILSYLLHKQGIPLLPYGIIAAKKDITDQTYIQYAD